MKKLYTLLLGVAVAVSASALTPNRSLAKAMVAKSLQNPSLTIKANAEKLEATIASSEIAAEINAAKKQEAAQKQAAAKIPESWEDAGTVLYADAFLMPLFYDEDAGSQNGISCQDFVEGTAWEVPVMRSTRNENRIKLVDPYHQDGIKQLFGDDFNSILTDEGFDIILDASNPTFVSMDLQHIMTFNSTIAAQLGITEMWGWVEGNRYLNMGYSAASIANAGIASDFKNGIITLKNCMFAIANDKENATFCWGGTPYNGLVTFADAKDVKFNYQAASSCSNNMKHTFSVTLGADMASAKYFLYPGELSATNESQLNAIETELGEYLVDITETTGNDTEAQFADAVGYADGPATLFLLGYDADGTRVNAEIHPVFFAFDEPEKWEPLGQVKYTDDIVGPLWNFEATETDPNKAGEVTTYDVPLERNIENPSVYRLVNPYNAPGWKYTSFNTHVKDNCKHFMVIDATDPQAVMVPTGYTGFNLSGIGYMMLASVNYLDNTLTEYNGKLENGVITFPAEAFIQVYSQLLNDSKDALRNLPGNFSGLFKVDLNTSGISDVTISVNDNAPVEYFNLQGVRVANPAAGELVIKRQGDKVSKTVIR